MFSFEKLNVYREAVVFVEGIYRLTRSFPREELFGLTSQLKRAAVSVVLNIAEGTSRTKKDFRHFLDLARGSCFEVVAILSIAQKLGYVTDDEFGKAYADCVKISGMISSLKRSLS